MCEVVGSFISPEADYAVTYDVDMDYLYSIPD